MTPTEINTSTPTHATETPTATGTPTEGVTETPTPVVNPPMIYLAGYWNTYITTAQGGTLTLQAFVMDADGLDDVVSVEIVPGVFLNDHGVNGDLAPNDGLWAFSVFIPSGLPATRVSLTLLAKDSMGLESTLWPYLTVTE